MPTFDARRPAAGAAFSSDRNTNRCRCRDAKNGTQVNSFFGKQDVLRSINLPDDICLGGDKLREAYQLDFQVH